MANIVDFPETWEQAAPQVLPKVRNSTYWHSLQMRAVARFGWEGLEKVPPSIRCDLLEGILSFGLCYDTRDFTRNLSSVELERWGVTFEQALAQSIENLVEMSSEAFLVSNEELQLAPWDDSHAAGRILCLEALKILPHEGSLVVSIPDQAHLFLADSANREAVAALLDESERCLGKGPLLYPPPLIYNEGRWSALEFPESDPLYPAWRRLHLLTLAAAHNGQQQLLTTWFQAQGENFYVSKWGRSQLTSGLGRRSIPPRCVTPRSLMPDNSRSDAPCDAGASPPETRNQLRPAPLSSTFVKRMGLFSLLLIGRNSHPRYCRERTRCCWSAVAANR